MAKIGFISLGCEKNTSDTEYCIGALLSAGHEITGDPAEADCIVINTCGFIRDARDEAEEAIREMLALKKERPGLRVIVAGCYAQRNGKALGEKFPEADAFLGVEPQHAICSAVERVLEGGSFCHAAPPFTKWQEPENGRYLLTPFWRGNLKITEGCSNRCSYCAIPLIRGGLRSRPLEAAVREAEAMAENGVRELTVIGQDVTAYGKDLGRPELLCDLLERLGALEGLRWIRLMYTYPDEISERLTDAMASVPKVLRYIDMPLQHADDGILRKMNRRGTAEKYLRLIERLRKAMPDIALRTTFITGFPGETEEAFERLLAFIREARFDRAGFFGYSPEPGTRAYDMPDRVPEEVIGERKARLAEALEEISLEKNRALTGRTMDVLIENASKKHSEGRTYRDAPEVDGVVVIKGAAGRPGDFVKVKITGTLGVNDLQGTVSKERNKKL